MAAQDSNNGVERPKSLFDRLVDLENEIFGTREEGYKDGLKPKLSTLTQNINRWGIAIILVLALSKFLSPEAVGVVKDAIKLFAGG
jgi:hypothetical protein